MTSVVINQIWSKKLDRSILDLDIFADRYMIGINDENITFFDKETNELIWEGNLDLLINLIKTTNHLN